jgi:hypothetical protein
MGIQKGEKGMGRVKETFTELVEQCNGSYADESIGSADTKVIFENIADANLFLLSVEHKFRFSVPDNNVIRHPYNGCIIVIFN